MRFPAQGSLLCPVLFDLFISSLDQETEHSLSKFADSSKLGGVADTPEGCATVQQDLERLESWVERNLLKCNKSQVETVGGVSARGDRSYCVFLSLKGTY